MSRALIVFFFSLVCAVFPAFACEPSGSTPSAIHGDFFGSDGAPRLSEMYWLLQAGEEVPGDMGTGSSEDPDKRSHWLKRRARAGVLITVGTIGTLISVPLAATFGYLTVGMLFIEGDSLSVLYGLFLGVPVTAVFIVTSALSISAIVAGVRLARAEKETAMLVPTSNGLALVGRF